MSSETIELCEYVTVVIDGQSFGVPVLLVQDVLREQPLTHIPLAPAEIAGSLNLRGRVVTAIDLRTRLGVERRVDDGRIADLCGRVMVGAFEPFVRAVAR